MADESTAWQNVQELTIDFLTETYGSVLTREEAEELVDHSICQVKLFTDKLERRAIELVDGTGLAPRDAYDVLFDRLAVRLELQGYDVQ